MIDKIPLLEQFIRSLLPAKDSSRQNTYNELQYLYKTIGNIFKQRFGFVITDQEMLKAFQDLGYQVTLMKGEMTEGGRIKPSKTGDVTSIKQDRVAGSNVRLTTYEDNDCSFIYINVSSDMVANLRKTTARLPAHTREDLLQDIEKLNDRLQAFTHHYFR